MTGDHTPAEGDTIEQYLREQDLFPCVPNITLAHVVGPLVVTGGGNFIPICAHDDANGCNHQMLYPVLGGEIPEAEQVGGHIRMLLAARYN